MNLQYKFAGDDMQCLSLSYLDMCQIIICVFLERVRNASKVNE